MKKLKDILSEQNASKINKKLSKLDKKISEQDRLGAGGRFELQTKAMGGTGDYFQPEYEWLKPANAPTSEDIEPLYKFLTGDAKSTSVEEYLNFLQDYQGDPNKTSAEYIGYEKKERKLFDKVCTMHTPFKCDTNGDIWVPRRGERLDSRTAAEVIRRDWPLTHKYRHDIALVGGIIGAFTGYTEVAMAIGLIDAAMYKADGDEYMAGLCVVIEMVPYIGKPLGLAFRWTKAEAKVLIAKLTGRSSGKLTARELKIINHAAENSGRYSKPILQNMKASLQSGKVGSTSARKKILAKLEKFAASKTGQIAITLAQYATVIQFYDALAEANGWKRAGVEFKDVKSWFLSDGSTRDNLLLGKCLESGWEPGEDVPPKYQTETYKQDLAQIKSISTDRALQELDKDELRFENYNIYKLKDLLISSSSNKKSINEGFLGTVIGIGVVIGIGKLLVMRQILKWAVRAFKSGALDRYGPRAKRIIMKILDKVTKGQFKANTKIAGRPVKDYIPKAGGFRDAFERAISKESTSAEVEAAYRSGRGVVASNAKGMQKSVKDYWLDIKLQNPIYAGQRNHPDLVKEWESIVDTQLYKREWNFASPGSSNISRDEFLELQDLWKRETNPVLNWYNNYRHPNKYKYINNFHTNESLAKYLIEKPDHNILDFMHKNFARNRDDFSSFSKVKIFDSDAKGTYRWQAAQGRP